MSLVTPRKGYKSVKWLFGKEIEIPEEWEMEKLGNVVQSTRLGTNQVGVVGGSGIPLLKMGNLVSGGFNFKKLERILIEDVENIEQYFLQKNDFLFNTRNTDVLVGKCSVWKNEFPQAIFNNNLMRIIFSESIENTDYISYFLNSHNGKRSLRRLVDATTSVAAIYYGNLKLLKLLIPPLQEQQKIASILSNVDNLIESTVQVITHSKKVKTGLMQKLLTRGIGHTKFKKVTWLFGKEIEIPEEWEYGRIEHFCNKITSGGTPNRDNSEYYGGQIPWIKSGELKNNFLSESEEKISEKGLSESSAKLFPKNTLLIAMYGVTIGKTAILEKEATTNQAICAILPNTNFDSFYLQQLLISMKNILISFGMGAGQPNINQEIIKTLHIPLPPLSEQQKIATILSNIDSKITSQEQYKEKLEKLKKSLMQKLLTGEVRV